MHVGLIGSGNISETHARAAAAEGLTVSAVAGRTLDGARRLCDRHGGTPYDSLDACLRHPGLEMVIVTSPSGLHAEQGAAAARRGLHVLVEKPIDITPERADRLIAEADAAGVCLAVCYQDRFAPGLAAARAAIAAGRLGRPLLVEAQLPWYRPPSYYATSTWRGTRALDGGGALINQGSHTVDLLLWLLGDVVRLSAQTATVRHAIEVEDWAAALLEFDSGVRGTLSVTTAACPGLARRITISGTEGTLVIERDAIVAALGADGPLAGIGVEPPAADDGRSATPVVGDISGHQAVIEDFVRAVRMGTRPRCDGPDGRRSVAVIDAVYRSAAAGGAPVALARPSEGRQTS